MINLSNLPGIVVSKKKRVGRGLGSGVGTFSGRGHRRHQKAREKIKIWFEGGQNRLIKKFPLLRGKGRLKPHKKPHVLSLDDLNRLPPNTIVDIENLKKFQIITDAKIFDIKILARGDIKIPLILKLEASEGAKKKIEKAGGKVMI